MQDLAVAKFTAVSDQRKQAWDKTAQTRRFNKGDKVYRRRSGLNTKLSDSWEGPYMREKRNTPLFYRVNTGDRLLQSVHIQLLKEYTPITETEPQLRRVTSVLDSDSETDSMDDQYSEAKVTGTMVAEGREADIRVWEVDFKDILMKEPGLANVSEFRIDTGDHPPIHQRPYNTPCLLLDSINKEIE